MREAKEQSCCECHCQLKHSVPLDQDSKQPKATDQDPFVCVRHQQQSRLHCTVCLRRTVHQVQGFWPGRSVPEINAAGLCTSTFGGSRPKT